MAVLLAVLAWAYVTGGGGLQFFSLSFPSASVWLGLIHLLGLGSGACLCFAIGVGLCAHGLVPPGKEDGSRAP